MMSSVWCTFTRVGFHHWLNAAEKLPERAYLASTHRHLFHFRIEVPVTHDDRDVEFHDLRDYCASFVLDGDDFGPASCEGIAWLMVKRVLERYPMMQWVTVTVSEDDEAGATVTSVLE